MVRINYHFGIRKLSRSYYDMESSRIPFYELLLIYLLVIDSELLDLFPVYNETRQIFIVAVFVN